MRQGTQSSRSSAIYMISLERSMAIKATRFEQLSNAVKMISTRSRSYQRMPVPQLAYPTQELVLSMIAEPVLLSWDQLVAMPPMRKRAGRGGKGACVEQRRLRVFCFENNIRQVDLSNSDYDWRLLLKTMPSVRTQIVIGPGVVRFTFRLLDTIDWNYYGNRRRRVHGMHMEDTGVRHVFEICCADGDAWHAHFHQRGSCDLQHVRFNVS